MAKLPNNEKTLPEWMSYLVGESPLLSSATCEYIADLRSRMVDEIKKAPKISPDKCVSLKGELSLVKDNFKQVVEHLGENQAHRQRFADTYPRWQRLRHLNVRELRNIANSIEETRRNCQIASASGSLVSLIGGVVCLASGLRTGRPARWDGAAMMGVGAVTSAGACVAEVALLRARVREAKAILEEDEECSGRLWEFMSDGSRLQGALDAVRYADVDVRLKLVADTFSRRRLRNSSRATAKEVREALRSLRVSPEMAEEISDVVGILVATSVLYDRHRPLFHLATASFRCVRQLSFVVDALRTASALNSVLGGRRLSSLAAQNARLAVGMVLDVVNILLVCKDFDARSRQAEAILEASRALEREAEIFEEYWNTLQHPLSRFPAVSDF